MVDKSLKDAVTSCDHTDEALTTNLLSLPTSL